MTASAVSRKVTDESELLESLIAATVVTPGTEITATVVLDDGLVSSLASGM